MNTDKLNRFWLLATFLLILIIIISSVVIGVRQNPGQPLAIAPPSNSAIKGEINIDGAIHDPGTYPWKNGDSFESILRASGGIDSSADTSRIRLYIPKINQGTSPQKININRAEAWLLQALPNVGETRAQAVIDYRNQNGLFRNIEEISKVPGISNSIFEKIKPFITTGE